MSPARNIAFTALLLSCALAILLARCGTGRDIPSNESGMDGGPSSGAPDAGVDGGIDEDRDGGMDGGEQPDGGNNQDGGIDGGQQNDGGMALSFERDIKPIFQARCSGCHAPPSPAGGLDLSPDVSWENLVNQPTNCRPTVPRVAPSDPPGSMLWRKTKPVGLPDRCGGVMPLGTQGLGVIAPEDFAKVEDWIQQGALDN